MNCCCCHCCCKFASDFTFTQRRQSYTKEEATLMRLKVAFLWLHRSCLFKRLTRGAAEYCNACTHTHSHPHRLNPGFTGGSRCTCAAFPHRCQLTGASSGQPAGALTQEMVTCVCVCELWMSWRRWKPGGEAAGEVTNHRRSFHCFCQLFNEAS